MKLRALIFVGAAVCFASAAAASALAGSIALTAITKVDDVCPKGHYVDLLLRITKKAESSTRAAEKAAYTALLTQLKDYSSKCEKYAKAHGGS